jgi:ankyrin repeat protein
MDSYLTKISIMKKNMFVLAAANGVLEDVYKYYPEDNDVNYIQNNYLCCNGGYESSALLEAARNNYTKVFMFLIENGADVSKFYENSDIEYHFETVFSVCHENSEICNFLNDLDIKDAIMNKYNKNKKEIIKKDIDRMAQIDRLIKLN